MVPVVRRFVLVAASFVAAHHFASSLPATIGFVGVYFAETVVAIVPVLVVYAGSDLLGPAVANALGACGVVAGLDIVVGLGWGLAMVPSCSD